MVSGTVHLPWNLIPLTEDIGLKGQSQFIEKVDTYWYGAFVYLEGFSRNVFFKPSELILLPIAL